MTIEKHRLQEIDWKKGPGYKKVTAIKIPNHDVITLPNGVKLITINQGTQEIIKLDIIWRGGRLHETKKLTSKFASSMMREGSQSYSSIQIAEEIDFYGGILRSASNLDFNYLSLSMLTKHFGALLPVVCEIVWQPVFDADELEKQKKTNIQKLAQDIAKNDLLSYRIFTEALYGTDDAYGYNTEEHFIADIQRADLVDFYERSFGTDNCFIVLAGRYEQREIDLIAQHFGSIAKATKPLSYTNGHIAPATTIRMESKNEMQCSIKMGRRMFGRHHEDYAGFLVLNTILGGYFGSRLMSRVREDLGLTYNIFSLLDYMIYDGYFYIGTEVSPENVDKTMEEISHQIDELCTTKVKLKELEMVKNYLMGNMLNLIDGPLNTSNLIKSLELDGSLEQQFSHAVDVLQNIDSTTLRDLAQKYLQMDKMTTVIVGP